MSFDPGRRGVRSPSPAFRSKALHLPQISRFQTLSNHIQAGRRNARDYIRSLSILDNVAESEIREEREVGLPTVRLLRRNPPSSPREPFAWRPSLFKLKPRRDAGSVAVAEPDDD